MIVGWSGHVHLRGESPLDVPHAPDLSSFERLAFTGLSASVHLLTLLTEIAEHLREFERGAVSE